MATLRRTGRTPLFIRPASRNGATSASQRRSDPRTEPEASATARHVCGSEPIPCHSVSPETRRGGGSVRRLRSWRAVADASGSEGTTDGYVRYAKPPVLAKTWTVGTGRSGGSAFRGCRPSRRRRGYRRRALPFLSNKSRRCRPAAASQDAKRPMSTETSMVGTTCSLAVSRGGRYGSSSGRNWATERRRLGVASAVVSHVETDLPMFGSSLESGTSTSIRRLWPGGMCPLGTVTLLHKQLAMVSTILPGPDPLLTTRKDRRIGSSSMWALLQSMAAVLVVSSTENSAGDAGSGEDAGVVFSWLAGTPSMVSRSGCRSDWRTAPKTTATIDSPSMLYNDHTGQPLLEEPCPCQQKRHGNEGSRRPSDRRHSPRRLGAPDLKSDPARPGRAKFVDADAVDPHRIVVDDEIRHVDPANDDEVTASTRAAKRNDARGSKQSGGDALGDVRAFDGTNTVAQLGRDPLEVGQRLGPAVQSQFRTDEPERRATVDQRALQSHGGPQRPSAAGVARRVRFGRDGRAVQDEETARGRSCDDMRRGWTSSGHAMRRPMMKQHSGRTRCMPSQSGEILSGLTGAPSWVNKDWL